MQLRRDARRPYDPPVRSARDGLAAALHRNLVIRPFESLYHRRRVFRYWRDLEESQWLDRSALQALQFEALRRLVEHAARHCPWYRDSWREAGLGALQLKSIEDFARWPLVTRETVRLQRSAMRTTAPGIRLIPKATGGSSGEPLHFDLDTDSNDRRMAAWFRGYRWAGAGPGTRQFYLWGVPLGDVPEWKRWKLRVYDRIYRRNVVSSFGLSENAVPAVLRQMQRYRPDVVVGYTNPLYEFARSLKERGLQGPPLRGVVVGAEKLHGHQREAIEQAFQAPVFETYGSREFMMMAGECDRHAGLHLVFEHLLVEVVDDDGRPANPGTEGSVVVTDLYNYGMPFVRYLNGDRAIAGFGSCPCGRGLPTLQQVTGRQLDIVVTPDGRRVPGEIFPHLLKDFAAVRRFQVIQERRDEVVLRLVVTGPEPAPLEAIRPILEAALGPRVALKIEIVSEIPVSRSGKLQVVVSRVDASRGAR